MNEKKKIREFETGATRDSDDGKLDMEGFYHPAVMTRFAQYMHKHRVQANGELRASDNWQKGIPVYQYMKSMLRHVMEFWTLHRSMLRDKRITENGFSLCYSYIEQKIMDDMEELLCAILFNVQGYLFELLKKRGRL